MATDRSGKRTAELVKGTYFPNHSHAWRGTWNRPMYIDEDAHHPFTIARMTDHNVRGVDGGRDERLLLRNSRRVTEQPKAKKAA